MWKLRYSEIGFRIAFLLNDMRHVYRNSNLRDENIQVSFAKFILCFIAGEPATNDTDVLTEFVSPTPNYPCTKINANLSTLGLDMPEAIDGLLFKCIQQNSMLCIIDNKEKNKLRTKLYDLGVVIQSIQHYFYHARETVVACILSKLLTRFWWIYHTSSPIMEPITWYEDA
jgi:hypothetical protein